MDNFNARRREKQPLDLPSAGSIFKRPEGYFAGKLVQDCGLRGYRIGGAEVSALHCGFIVNTGSGRRDVISLIEYIKDAVYNKFESYSDGSEDNWRGLNTGENRRKKHRWGQMT